jgi:nicotinamidase-related amidase
MASRNTRAVQRTCLLISDVQNDYCSPGGKLFDRSNKRPEVIAEFVDQVARLLQSARAAGIKVAFIRNTHLRGGLDVSAERLERLRSATPGATVNDASCIEGTWGHRVVDALDVREDNFVIDKFGYGLFEYSIIDKVLRAHALTDIVLTGIASYGGILAAVPALNDRDYRFTIPRECVAGYDAELHEAAMKLLKPHLVGVADVIAAWTSGGSPR